MKKIIPVILLTFFGGGGKTTFASHVSGCDITYNYLGNLKYVIYIDVFRDCRGQAISSSDFTYYYRFQNNSGVGQHLTAKTNTSNQNKYLYY